MYIPSREYKKIVARMPILCVDALIERNDKFLLLKRKNEPLMGRYWVPGGRLHRNEAIHDAVRRIVSQETGMEVDSIWFSDYYEEVFDVGTYGPIHSVSLVFIVKARGKVVLDEQSERYKWGLLPLELEKYA